MRSLKAKFNKALALKFEDPKMEKEYHMIKTQNARVVFLGTALFMLIINTMAVVSVGIQQRWDTFYFSLGTSILIVFLILISPFIKKHIQYLTLLALIAFMLARLLSLFLQYTGYTKISVFYLGFVTACIQDIILSKIHNFLVQVLTTILLLVIRYAALIVGESSNFTVLLWIRFVGIDLFILYMLYFNEKCERRVFRNFFESRDELIKFKELLAESLPQSLVVVAFQTQKKLFANNTFESSFEMMDPGDCILTEPPKIEENSQKLNLKILQVDLTTLREVGTEDQIRLNSHEERDYSPQELLSKLTEQNLLKGKALYVNAFCKQKEKTRNFEITFKRIKWDTVEAIAMLINDTTYQANLVALKMANINKDQVIATVSHELRTPLHGIIGLLDLAETRVKDSEVLNHLSLCKDNAYLLSSLVNSLLDLQQLATGKLKLHETRIRIPKTLDDVLQLFKFQADQKNIRLELEIQKNVPEFIITDENRLKQILINLIGNAIKFTFKGGVKVVVSLDPDNTACLIISVNDTGIGIKEEDIGKLFTMYGKLANGSTVNKNGVGLGLTISSTLAALLNGQNHEKGVEVESRYGVGSKFFFRILKNLKSPNGKKTNRNGDQDREEENCFNHSTTERENTVALENSDELDNQLSVSARISNYSLKGRQTQSFQTSRGKLLESKTESELSSQERIGSGSAMTQHSKKHNGHKSVNECVLVVDDNPFNILVAKSLLKDIGHEVKSASSGQEAIEIVKTCKKEGVHIKVIFMDCQMPIMDGYETTRILDDMMGRGEIPRVAILAWTANTGEQDIKKCYESGMTGHLPKPITKENILKVIPK